MFDLISKHLIVCQKYCNMRGIFNSPLEVWNVVKHCFHVCTWIPIERPLPKIRRCTFSSFEKGCQMKVWSLHNNTECYCSLSIHLSFVYQLRGNGIIAYWSLKNVVKFSVAKRTLAHKVWRKRKPNKWCLSCFYIWISIQHMHQFSTFTHTHWWGCQVHFYT